MRKSVPIMKALITVLFGIGVCSCSTTRISEVGESTPKLDSMVYYIFRKNMMNARPASWNYPIRMEK